MFGGGRAGGVGGEGRGGKGQKDEGRGNRVMRRGYTYFDG